MFFIFFVCLLQPQVVICNFLLQDYQISFEYFCRDCKLYILPPMDDATIKSNLERKRTELGYSQTEMARRLEISLNAYRKLERGTTRILNEHIEKFARETGVSVAELVNGFEPIDSVETGLHEVKDNYSRIIGEIESNYRKELEALKAENAILKEKLKSKEETLEYDRKLISRYEKELGRLSENGKG